MTQATVSVNGGPRKTATMDLVDTIDGESRYQCMLDGVILEADEIGSFFSVSVDNGMNAATTRPVRVEGCVNCCKFSTAELPVMTRQRFTFGDVPPERGKALYEFAPPHQPTWNDSDILVGWGYGIQKAPTDTGGRPELSAHHPHWVLDRKMRRSYADGDGIYPTLNRDPVAPYAPIARDGYQTGLNNFSHEGWKAGHKNIGRKPQLPHLYANSDYAADVDGDRFYRDSVISTGNYAAMYNHPTPWPNCASELRGIGRGLRAMIAATLLDGNVWRRDKILATIKFLDDRAGDIFSVPFCQKTDPVKGKYIPWWEFAMVAYAIDMAVRFGFVEKSAYLDALLAFQLQLTPDTVGSFMPYWLLYRDQSQPPVLSNLVASNPNSDREAELRVMGEIIRCHGGTPQRPLNELMLDVSKYPSRNNACFAIVDSSRPPRQKWLSHAKRSTDAAAWQYGPTEVLADAKHSLSIRLGEMIGGYLGEGSLDVVAGIGRL